MSVLNNAEKLKIFFHKLDKNSLGLVTEFYHPQVEFIDPVGTIKGSDKIKKYYEGMYKNAATVKFDFKNTYQDGNTVIAIWTMTLETDKLNGGKPYSVDGNSVVKFAPNGQAIYHRDYFDMGAFVYEKIPVIGFVVKKIRENMEHKE